MRLRRFQRFAVRGIVGGFVFFACVFALALAERLRTETELNAVLSTYLSDDILNDAHDWGSGSGILVVLQCEAQQPGMWRWRYPYPFDKRSQFTQSSLFTRSSFM